MLLAIPAFTPAEGTIDGTVAIGAVDEVRPVASDEVDRPVEEVAFELSEANASNPSVRVLHGQETLPAYMSGGAGIAGTTGFTGYTVEFCYSEKEYVLSSTTAPRSRRLASNQARKTVTSITVRQGRGEPETEVIAFGVNTSSRRAGAASDPANDARQGEEASFLPPVQ